MKLIEIQPISETDFGSEFAGKHVVITGAAGTYGRQLAKAFANLGAMLYLADYRRMELESFAQSLSLPPDRIALCFADLTTSAGIEQTIATIAVRCNAPDVIINNAAVFPFGDLMETSSEEWDLVMNLNIRVPFLLSQRFARMMIDCQKGGCIINIGSAAGKIIRLNGVPYCVSKSALQTLSNGFALRLAHHHIRVNLIEAGLPAESVDSMPESHVANVSSAIPLSRTAGPHDLANAAIFLASSSASYITGATLAVNGGLSVCSR